MDNGQLPVKTSSNAEVNEYGSTDANFPKVAIIILNWNGWQDTIECLESIFTSTYKNYNIFLVDNASTDGSVSKIKYWANNNGISIIGKENNNKLQSANQQVFLLPQYENLGFAKGNNVAIKKALETDHEYVFLLNNDAVIVQNTIEELVSCCEDYHYLIATARIYLYDRPDTLWNAGGELTFTGSRKYYTTKEYAQFPKNIRRVREITFATGCALMIKGDLIKKLGALTERFFFGEEDYEFCMRLKKNGIKIACVDSAIAYHKVGSSAHNLFEQKVNSDIVHYLNRIIDMKYYYSRPYWYFWRFSVALKALTVIKFKHKVDIVTSVKSVLFIMKRSLLMDQVSKEDVDLILSGRWK